MKDIMENNQTVHATSSQTPVPSDAAVSVTRQCPVHRASLPILTLILALSPMWSKVLQYGLSFLFTEGSSTASALAEGITACYAMVVYLVLLVKCGTTGTVKKLLPFFFLGGGLCLVAAQVIPMFAPFNPNDFTLTDQFLADNHGLIHGLRMTGSLLYALGFFLLLLFTRRGYRVTLLFGTLAAAMAAYVAGFQLGIDPLAELSENILKQDSRQVLWQLAFTSLFWVSLFTNAVYAGEGLQKGKNALNSSRLYHETPVRIIAGTALAVILVLVGNLVFLKDSNHISSTEFGYNKLVPLALLFLCNWITQLLMNMKVERHVLRAFGYVVWAVPVLLMAVMALLLPDYFTGGASGWVDVISLVILLLSLMQGFYFWRLRRTTPNEDRGLHTAGAAAGLLPLFLIMAFMSMEQSVNELNLHLDAVLFPALMLMSIAYFCFFLRLAVPALFKPWVLTMITMLMAVLTIGDMMATRNVKTEAEMMEESQGLSSEEMDDLEETSEDDYEGDEAFSNG